MIEDLNNYKDWREMFGPISARLKDKELILRFLASYYNESNYSKPMVEFLNKFNKKNRNPKEDFKEESSKLFKDTITYLKNNVGRNAFRPEGVLNVSVFEGVTVGLAKIIKAKGNPDSEIFKKIQQQLINDNNFLKAATSGTSDDAVFKERHSIVTKYFSSFMIHNEDLKRQSDRILKLIEDAENTFDEDDEMRSHLAKYICVLCSGFLENAIHSIYADYVKKETESDSLISFATTTLNKVQNPNSDRFRDIAKSFKLEWDEPLKLFLQEEERSSVSFPFFRAS